MATPPRADEHAESEDASVESRIDATPDEDGPHDVPDDEVIDKTLPPTGRQRPPAERAG